MKQHPNARKLTEGLLPIVRVEGENIRAPMAERLKHYSCPGVGVAVIENDEVAWAEGYGVREAGGTRPVDDGTMFAGASISKPVAATIALMLVEQGKLALDKNVNTILKSWKLPENEFTKQSPVTLRWLLMHKAGTTVHGFGAMYGADPYSMVLPTNIQTLDGVPPAQTPPVRVNKVPGGTVRYSGGGTTLVELMIEDVTGKPFAKVADEMIFGPLAMTRTTYEQPLPKSFLPWTSWGHDEEGKVVPGQIICTPQLAAGGIYTTPSDYARFMIETRKASIGRPNKLMNQRQMQEMMTPTPGEDQAIGWRILGTGQDARFEHSGSNNGYQCEATAYLHRGDGAVVMTNAAQGLIFYWEVLNTIAEVQGWRGFLPEPKRIVPIPVEKHPLYAGEYKIVSGIEAPFLKIWSKGGKLYSEIPGMRGGEREMLMDQKGRIFNRIGPYETQVVYDERGRAKELIVLEFGTTEILRAQRNETAS